MLLNIKEANWQVLQKEQFAFPQPRAIIKPAKDYLVSSGIPKALLKEIPFVALAPSTDSSHWLQGVLCLGNTNITIKEQYSSNIRQHVTGIPQTVTSVIFSTPQDEINQDTQHRFQAQDEAPEIYGDLLLRGYGYVHSTAGVTDYKDNGSSGSSYEYYIHIPEKLKSKIDPQKKYRITAILLEIESSVFHEKIYPRSKKIGVSTLLATDFTPVE